MLSGKWFALSVSCISGALVLCQANTVLAGEPTPDLKKARELLYFDDIHVVVAHIKDTLKNNQSAMALEILALAYTKAQAKTTAIALARDAMRLDPKNANILASAAKIYCDFNEPEAALPLAKRAVQLDGKNARNQAVLGNCYVLLEKMPDAKKAFETAFELDATDFDVNELAIDFYLEELNKKEMESCYDRMVKFHPTWPQGYVERAEYMIRRGKHDAAASDFAEAAKHNPKHLHAVSHRAKALYHQKRWAEAAQACTDFMKVTGKTWAFCGRRGHCYYSIGKWANAIEDFNVAIKYLGSNKSDTKLDARALKNNSEYTRYWFERSVSYGKLGQSQRALVDLTNAIVALELSPKEYKDRQYVLGTIKELGTSLKELNEITGVGPAEADFFRARAEVYSKLGKTMQAQHDLAQAEKLDPEK